MAKKKATKKTVKKKDKVEEVEEVKDQEVPTEAEVEESPKAEENPEIEEKTESGILPEGAPDPEHCHGEFETATHFIYKIKHEHVAKYRGQKKIIIEKSKNKI